MSILRNPYLIGGLLAANLLQVAVVYSPAMNRLFHTQPFDLAHVVAIGAVASLVFWVEELRKLVARRAARARPARQSARSIEKASTSTT